MLGLGYISKQSLLYNVDLRWLDIVTTFTTSSYVKHRILHLTRHPDAISRVKTGEMNADVPIAGVTRKLNFTKMNLLYLLICTVICIVNSSVRSRICIFV